MQITEQHFVEGSGSLSNLWDIVYKTADGKYYITTNDVVEAKSLTNLAGVRIKELTQKEALAII